MSLPEYGVIYQSFMLLALNSTITVNTSGIMFTISEHYV